MAKKNKNPTQRMWGIRNRYNVVDRNYIFVKRNILLRIVTPNGPSVPNRVQTNGPNGAQMHRPSKAQMNPCLCHIKFNIAQYNMLGDSCKNPSRDFE